MADREGGPPPLKLWRTGPPSLKLWRTGHPEVMRFPFFSVARYRLVAAARGTSRRDGRALRVVAAAATRSAACERELRPGPDRRSMTPLTQLTLLRFFRKGVSSYDRQVTVRSSTVVMACKLRVECPGGIHHVMGWGESRRTQAAHEAAAGWVWAGGLPEPFSGFIPPRSAPQGSSFLATQGLKLGSLRDALRFAVVTPGVAWCLATQGLNLGSLRDALGSLMVLAGT
jgi:hypothetical protein